MKINISAKNYKVSDKLEEQIEKKLQKLSKYFQDDVNTSVVVSKFKDETKIEATINAKQAVFRAEAISEDNNLYEALDEMVDRLSNQMSKLKGKLESRYKENKALKFEFIPDNDEEEEEEQIVVKRKSFELQPMVAEEAILQMEMLGHDFFVYLDMDTDSVNVVYKRKGNNYGVIETVR